MEKIKFTLFSVIILAVIALAWYWSISTIESGSEHASREKIDSLEKENENLREEIKVLQSELGTIQAEVVEPAVVEPSTSTSSPSSGTTYKNQVLIDELQKLVNDKVNMKLKSAGTRVGTVQKFLNLYNNTSSSVDNDYGAGTQKAVTAFQKAEGLTADGEAGSSTFTKMIEWLKKQG